MNALKKTVVSLGLAVAFLFAAGMADSSMVSAQDWRWRNRDRWDDRDRDRDRDRRNDRWNDRWDDRGRRDRIDNREEMKGYRDGLDRGREDFRDRRSPNPNNSSHFRNGNQDYRQGFRRGYSVGFRQSGGGGRFFYR